MVCNSLVLELFMEHGNVQFRVGFKQFKDFLRFLLRLALSFVHVGFRIRVWLRYIFFACA